MSTGNGKAPTKRDRTPEEPCPICGSAPNKPCINRRGRGKRPCRFVPPKAETNGHADPPEYRPGNSRLELGRPASTIVPEDPTWLVEGLVPRNCLTLVVGAPGAGKSTLGAWLCSLAKRPAILSGSEESLECALYNRLVKNGVNMDRCLILDNRPISLPSDRQILSEYLAAKGVDFLWLDPIDSYCAEGSENDGQVVRAALESLARLARDLRVTVVGARHPGKSAGNICPGSRAWRAVPREVLVAGVDDGPPLRRWLRPTRDPFSFGVHPRSFELVGEEKKPKKFVLGVELDPAEADIMAVTDSVDRWKIDQAQALLQHLLADSEQDASWVYAMAEKEKIGDRLMRQAAKRLGVIVTRSGNGREHKSTWSLPHSGTPAVPE